MPLTFPKLFAAIAAGTIFLSSASAKATTVSPVIVDVQTNGRGATQAISVTNTGAAPLPIEIETMMLDPTPSGFQPNKQSAEDLLVVPPSALIPPGKVQTFRVQWIGDPEIDKSKHFYVSVNQLPVKLPEGQSAVQVVSNFQVLVSVSSPDKKPQLAVVSAAPATIDGKAVAAVTVQNSGAAHGYISQHKLKITEISPSGAELLSKTISGSEFQSLVGYGLVASGQTRTVNVPLDKPVPPGARLNAVLMDERAQ